MEGRGDIKPNKEEQERPIHIREKGKQSIAWQRVAKYNMPVWAGC